jgi:hypothetical protein
MIKIAAAIICKDDSEIDMGTLTMAFPTVNFKSPRVKEFSDLQDANRKKLISVLKKDGIKVKYTKSWGVDFLDYSEAISPQNLQRYLDIMYEGIE